MEPNETIDESAIGVEDKKKINKSFVASRLDDVDKRTFSNLLKRLGETNMYLPRNKFLKLIKSAGLAEDDIRLRGTMEYLHKSDAHLTHKDLKPLRSHCGLVFKVMREDFIIPNFSLFADIIDELYKETLPVTSGANADYIPQLAKVDPNQFGVAVCSIDGQRHAIGDCDTPFCVQSVSKVITYAIAQTQHGPDVVHKHVGVEPSGRAFNEMALDDRAKKSDIREKKDMIRKGEIKKANKIKIRPAVPHNPYINAGAIMCASMVFPDKSQSDSFDAVMDIWKDLCGFDAKSNTLRSPTFANSTYLSEKASADRNFCLGYMMREEKAFLEGTQIAKSLENYFMYCSIECTVHTLSVVAATFANGGICPVTGTRIFSPDVVRNCLSIMQTCGMYDYSGQFAVRMGFPCKSGVGGALLIVIPGIAGFCTWSPRLDKIGNSVRGVYFCKLLAEKFAFHMFSAHTHHINHSLTEAAAAQEALKKYRKESIEKYEQTMVGIDSDKITSFARQRRENQKKSTKMEPMTHQKEMDFIDGSADLLWAAFDNNIDTVRNLVACGIDVDTSDYDLRTALHVASWKGHVEIVKYLLRLGADPLAFDRFVGIPLTDAKNNKHDQVVNLLASGLSTNSKMSSDKSLAHNIYRSILGLTEPDAEGFTRDFLCDVIERSGIRHDDPRPQQFFDKVPAPPTLLEPKHLECIIDFPYILASLQGHLEIPNWTLFTDTCLECFEIAKLNNSGECANYIPVLAEADPEMWGVSVCSVDGQRWSKGDVKQKFGVQSSMKAINYAIALETTSFRNVYEHIGIEPSGRPFNEIALDTRRLEADVEIHDINSDDDDFDATYNDAGDRFKMTAVPHNPMINAGAIMCCSLIEEGKNVDQKLSTVLSYWKRLTGGSVECEINERMYLSEADTANQNKCLAYLMNEYGAFPSGVDVNKELEFYFKCCSQMQDAESMSIVAATLANGGLCPITNERIFSENTVQAVLAVTFNCGMYDYSGQFSFSMGFPAKSGVGGGILLIVPNVMGICTFSPRLDGNGNSSRGITFAEELAKRYKIHVFDMAASLINYDGKDDPRHLPNEKRRDLLAKLMKASSGGAIPLVRSLANQYGTDLLNMSDYDMRTALHLACSMKQDIIVEYLTSWYGINLEPVDNWGMTPLEHAQANGSESIVKILENAIAKNKN
mmetsp:Transcript_32261/g.47463  ORF Transcript_32261/g.47463 Transcript_32261/m.47463 type:complete len:1175 (+) Transcript_32261:92-3616(+)